MSLAVAPPPLADEELLSARELADWLGVHVQTVYLWVKAKRLNPIRISRSMMRFRLSEVLALRQHDDQAEVASAS